MIAPQKTPRSRRRGAGGFTLVELILAGVMIAVLMLSLYTALGVALKARQAATTNLALARTAAVAIDIVRQDLEGALPQGEIITGPFIGDLSSEVDGSSEVYFYATGGPGAASLSIDTGMTVAGASSTLWNQTDPTRYAGVRKIGLLLRESADGKDRLLVRQITRNLLAPSEVEPEEEILSRGVRFFSLRYYDGTQWLDTWDSTLQSDVLPRAVEIGIEIQPDASPPATDAEAQVYRATQVILLPCANAGALQQGGVP